MGAGYAQAEEEFGAELVEYAGQWVAVENRSVVAYDPDLGNLVGQLNGQRDTAVIFRVEPDAAAADVK